MDFPSGDVEEIINRVNEDVRNLLFDNGEGILSPPVCCCCDSLLPTEAERTNIKLKTVLERKHLFYNRDKDLNEFILKDYQFLGVKDSESSMEKMMLSKRSCYHVKKKTLLFCVSCAGPIKHKKYPNKGICNGWFPGSAPQVLEDLTEVELALISPVRITGHIITYYRGEKGIKGWHSLVKCDLKSTVRTLRGMDGLDLPNKVVVILSGPMTAEQKKKIALKMTVRRDKCLLAIQHQIANNSLTKEDFAGFDFDNIPQPIIIDKSKEWIGEEIDSNVEMTEEYTILFPDTTLDQTYGGYATINDFKKVLDEVNQGSSSHFCLHSKSKDYVNDYCDDNIVRAFPKAFPYGRGGPNEKRFDNDNKPIKITLDKYLEHINRLSNPNFHSQMFSIVSYNILMRQKMLQLSCFKMKGAGVLGEKFSNLTEGDVTEYVSKRRNGVRNGSLAGAEFIELVDVITGALPHSNKAAAKARSESIAMQVQFGFPAIFSRLLPMIQIHI